VKRTVVQAEVRQQFLDRLVALVPRVVDELVALDRAMGREDGVAEWQRRYSIKGAWVAESASISLQLWAAQGSPGDRRIAYCRASPIEPTVPTFQFIVTERPYFRTGDLALFRESLHQALDASLDAFLAEVDPDRKPVPPATGDLDETAVDCLVQRLCLGLSPAAIIERLPAGKKRTWYVIERANRRLCQIIDLASPRPGRTPQK
jgi:hypothetical protein